MRLGRILVVSLLTAGWLLPLLLPPWVSWHHEVPVFSAVLLLSAMAFFGRAPSDKAHLSVPAAVLVYMILLLLAMAQAASGQMTFVGDALILGLYFFLVALGWQLGFSHAIESGRWATMGVLEKLAILLLLVACASAVLALVQAFDVWDGAGWVNRMPQLRRPGANLGQPNQLATLLLMGLVSLLYLYESRKLSGWTVALVFGLLAVGLAASESRTGLLNFVLLSLWWLVGRVRAGLRARAGAVAAAGLVFSGLFWFWPVVMAAIGHFEPGATVNTGDSLRLVVWSQLIEAVWQRPWLGWGLREVSEAHNAVVHAYAASAPFTYAHNIVLDLAIGVGIPLTLLLLGMSLAWLWRRIRAVKDLHTWYCVAAVLPVAVHSMLEFPFAYAYFLAPAMFFLGVLDGATGGKVVVQVNIKWLGAGWLVFAALGAWSVVEYLKIEEDFRIVRFESMRLGQTPQDYERPNIVLLTQLGALLEGGRIVPTLGMPAERIELARKVALRFPWPATQNRYALSLALNGQIDEAERQLQVIRALHGGKTYTEIKANWQTLAASKYPQLAQIRWP